MAKYIAFLRGINVGNIRIKMPDLVLAFEKMGFSSVKTYLQTGNVVFDSDKNKTEIKAILEKGLTQTFDYEAFVLIYDFSILTDIIAQYPMERDEEHHAYVIFIENPTIFAGLEQQAQEVGAESSDIIKGNFQVLYWRVARGESTDTVFSKILAKSKYKSTTTIRNINTLEKMV